MNCFPLMFVGDFANLIGELDKLSKASDEKSKASDEKIKAIAASRMDPRHAHLDALLDPE